jgi:protein arginine N-methyltransferase 1
MSIEFHRRMLADKVRAAAFHEALRRVIRPGETTVADIGAGTGFLGFLARRLGAREVHLVEHGPVIALAEELARRNGLDGLHFWAMPSGEILDLPAVDVVVAEVLGNLALEENALETLADARRFLKPGGMLLPQRLNQFIAPLATDRFRRELDTWTDIGFGLDFAPARRLSFDNVYVRRITPADLLAQRDAARQWDVIEFMAQPDNLRHGTQRWTIEQPASLHGFALWWRCELVPGVELTTSPFSAPTHWDQIYMPVLARLDCAAGDTVELALESETGGGESGIGLRWKVVHRRGDAVLLRESRDIGRGAPAADQT